MAKAPVLLDLDEERLAREGVKALLRPLAEHAQAVRTALAGGLTFAENFVAEFTPEFLVTIPAPTVHLVGGTGEPAFQNAWVNFLAATWSPASFSIDWRGIVRLRGLVSGGVIGAGNAIFTLPVGYRPALNDVYATDSNNAHGRLTITSAGLVVAEVGNNAYFSLGGVTFQADGACAAPEASAAPFPILRQLYKVAQPALVLAAKVIPRTVPGEPIGPVQVDWDRLGGGVRVKALHGLSPGRSYSVTLLVVGG